MSIDKKTLEIQIENDNDHLQDIINRDPQRASKIAQDFISNYEIKRENILTEQKNKAARCLNEFLAKNPFVSKEERDNASEECRKPFNDRLEMIKQFIENIKIHVK